MQLKSASQQITTQDEINEQTRRMAQQIQELNAIYTRMIEAMTVNMNPLATGQQGQNRDGACRPQECGRGIVRRRKACYPSNKTTE